MNMNTIYDTFASIIVCIVSVRSLDLDSHILRILYLWKLAASLPATPQTYVCKFNANKNSMKLV